VATRKRKSATASFDASRLKVLARADDSAYREAVLDLLRTADRFAREAALEALLELPVPDLRPDLRALYEEVDADGGKRDPGGHLRTLIARILARVGDSRDVDLGLRASDTREQSMGVDGTSNLRAAGLRLVAASDPIMFPFLAAEHVDDASTFSPEPANTALQLLAATGNEVAVYQWLVNHPDPDPSLVEPALELLADAPPRLMARCLTRLMRTALARSDEALITRLAETIVRGEMEGAYPAIASAMRGAVSKELYGYLALLLAGTNRPPLHAILEDQLESDIRRRPLVLDALRIRTTPEQNAILRRWEKQHA